MALSLSSVFSSTSPELPRRVLGSTGIDVSALGLGAAPLGDPALTDAAATRLVHEALALGVRVFDTAPSYGKSEERLGYALRGRRHGAVVVTKGGYGVPGAEDWTPEAIEGGIDRALATLGTDYLDVFLLHSCGLDLLTSGKLLEPLQRAKAAGKVRAIGYSGDGEPLAWVVANGNVDVIECSVSFVDQEALFASIPAAHAAGVGVIAKRPLANAPWTHTDRPAREDIATYWDRMQTFFPGGARDLALDELAVRFAAFADGVDCAVLGTRQPHHLERALRCLARGPLPTMLLTSLRAHYEQQAWPAII